MAFPGIRAAQNALEDAAHTDTRLQGIWLWADTPRPPSDLIDCLLNGNLVNQEVATPACVSTNQCKCNYFSF